MFKKRDLQQFFVFSSSLLLSFLVIMSQQAPAQRLQALPANIQPCVPTQTRLPIEQTKIVGQNDFKGSRYYLIAAFDAADDTPADLIIAVTRGKCKKLLFNPTGERVALAAYVPQPVARQLTLTRYRRSMKRLGGKANLQNEVNESAQQGATRWFEEEIWALRQLGITIPQNVRTL